MSGKIAIVDDDRDLGKIIYHRLRGAGYKCILISDSKKAFPVIKDRKPDIAILDVMMPKVSGYELCRQIRRDPLIFTTSVLMMSALGAEPEVEHALEQGADDYVIKPFDIGVLFSKIKSLMEKHNRAAEKNPLTGFHGGEYIKKIIANRLFREESAAVCYLSLTNYLPYIKAYGDKKRDEAIIALADILTEVTDESGVYECAIGHVGGPDFVVLLSSKDCERYCEEIIPRFRLKRNDFFSQTDIERGKFEVRDGAGGATEHPLMSVSIGVATNEKIKFRNSTHMVKVAGEVNRRAQENSTNGNIEILREGILL